MNGIAGLTRKVFALVRRDFIEEISYRLSFFMQLASIFLYLTLFYYLSKLFAGNRIPYLEKYGGDYFSFVLIGLSFSGYLNTGLTSFATTVRGEQMTGTLEMLLSTPTPLSLVFMARLIWNFIFSSFYLLVCFVFGVWLLGARYSEVNWAAVPVILLLSFAAFASLGMVSAGFIIMYKRGDPLNALLGFAASLLGGVFFPIQVLPAWLQKVSALLPVTYSLRLMRDACMRGAGFSELMPDLLLLFVLCVVFMAAGLAFFSFALRRAKSDGTLTHY